MTDYNGEEGTVTDYSHHEEYVHKKVPDFSGKITGRNSKENNWEDQRSVDNHYRNLFDLDSAKPGRAVGPTWPKDMDQR